MIILIQEAIKQRGGDDLMFFQSAYLWRFGKLVDISGDVLAWRTQHQIQPYIREYIVFLYKL